jgi:hypothetical protein
MTLIQSKYLLLLLIHQQHSMFNSSCVLIIMEVPVFGSVCNWRTGPMSKVKRTLRMNIHILRISHGMINLSPTPQHHCQASVGVALFHAAHCEFVQDFQSKRRQTRGELAKHCWARKRYLIGTVREDIQQLLLMFCITLHSEFRLPTTTQQQLVGIHEKHGSDVCVLNSGHVVGAPFILVLPPSVLFSSD